MLASVRSDPPESDLASPRYPAPAPTEPAPTWERSVYAPPRGVRAKALALEVLIFAAVTGAALIGFGRSSYTVSKPAAPLVVNLLPLASPPIEKREKVKPTPEKKQDKPRPVAPRVEAAPKPIVPLPATLIAPPPVRQPTLSTQPKQEENAAPPTVTAPPAPQVSSNAPDSWQGRVLARLGQFRRYPYGAQSRHEQGVPYIRFVMDRDGKILSSRIERSSGFPDLDREAVKLPKRAEPLPRPPANVTGDTIELVVPVEFFLH